MGLGWRALSPGPPAHPAAAPAGGARCLLAPVASIWARSVAHLAGQVCLCGAWLRLGVARGSAIPPACAAVGRARPSAIYARARQAVFLRAATPGTGAPPGALPPTVFALRSCFGPGPRGRPEFAPLGPRPSYCRSRRLPWQDRPQPHRRLQCGLETGHRAVVLLPHPNF